MVWYRPKRSLCDIRAITSGGLLLFAALVYLPVLAADEIPSKKLVQATTPQTPKSETPAQSRAVMPDAETILMLVRTTLLTLNDALRTRNFTVLHDGGAPGFRQVNSAERLSQVFSNFANQGVDLSTIATNVPQFTATPTLDPKSNMLRLIGYFPIAPMQVNFDLAFQQSEGRWHYFALGVSARSAPTAQEVPGQQRPLAEQPIKSHKGSK